MLRRRRNYKKNIHYNFAGSRASDVRLSKFNFSLIPGLKCPVCLNADFLACLHFLPI